MGSGSFTSSDWGSYKKATKVDYATTAHDYYATGSSSVKSEWLPYNVMRESCDSDEHPNSTPIILGLDVTGSMSHILTQVAKKLGDTMIEIINRKCVPDPQILFAAVDDYVTSGQKCLQVTQFESDIRIAKQMKELSFIERGGGNNWESYADVWYFANKHTKCDAITKGRKGVIITIGDDGVQPTINRDEIRSVFGDYEEANISTEKLLSKVNRDWEVFHISLAAGSSYDSDVKDVWDKYLGERHIVLGRGETDSLTEIIVSLLQTIKGDTVDEIAATWDNTTALAVKKTLAGLSVNKSGSDVIMF